MLRPRFEPGICNSKEPYKGNVMELNAPLLKGYRKYLENQKINLKTIDELFRNSVKYHHILYERDGSELVSYSNGKRKHIMKALTAFSKYSGCYETWQSIRKQYQMKWTSTDSLSGFHSMVKEDGNFTKMVEWVRESMMTYPRFSNILAFNALTGLRPGEAIQSLNLLRKLGKEAEYLSRDRRTLEHFRYPSIFLRRTKKAFISVVNENVLNLPYNQESINYDIIRLTFLRNNQRFHMSYCRKIFATFMRNEGIEPEIIDLLQGRIPNSVFVRHYYRPDPSKFDEIREKLTKLHSLLLN